MWQYPQQRQIAVSLRGKIKNIGKRILILCLKKSIYEENLSGRYERRNRSVYGCMRHRESILISAIHQIL